jgi:4-hydroxy-2-oxovalerate aldolase
MRPSATPTPPAAGARHIRVMDSTLRDGSHAMAHQFTPEQVSAIAAGLDAAGVEVIEISHGDGLGGSSINYGFSKHPEGDLLEAGQAALTRGKLAVLHIPGIGIKEDLQMAAAYGAKMARICTHCTEADVCQQHMQLAKSMGLEVVGFLMMAHMLDPQGLVEQARKMESYGADVVVLADSAGAMTPDDVRARVSALRQALAPSTQIGLHAHNNLGCAVANSLAAVEEGATCVDGTACGLGAGAGNTPTEVLVATLHKKGYATGIDLYKLMDVAEEIVRPLMPRPQVIDRAGLSLGYFGVYSSFLLHAERAAARFGVETRDILAELGARQVVGGQEDMILDLAVELAQRTGRGADARPDTAQRIAQTHPPHHAPDVSP